MENDFPNAAAFWAAIHARPAYVRPPYVRPAYVRPPYDARERQTLVHIALLEKFFAEKSGGQKLADFLDLHDKLLEENLE